ncbi:MAG: hypothetical protein AAFQ15_10915 [Pseudomonadota bacterium]
MKVTRRKLFAAAAGVGVTGAAAAGMGAHTLMTIGPARSYIADILRRRVPQIDVPADTIAAFAQDLLNAGDITLRERVVSYGGGAAASVLRAADLQPIETYERRIVTTFLINSDFFDEDRESERSVEYFGLSDTVCSFANPFAEFLS